MKKSETATVDSVARGIARNSVAGPPGDSAYDVAVANGFVGTEAQWLASLVGATGAAGANGAVGATGAAGTAGRTIHNGTGTPGGGLGVDGDFYIELVSGIPSYIYGPKTSGTWGPAYELRGPQGIQGLSGITELTEVASGGEVVWTGTGYQYRVSAAQYYIDGAPYSSIEQTVTLAASDGTNPRIDVIYVDNAGLVGKVTGTPSAAPSEPSVDPATQIQLAFVNVPAGSTEPPVVVPTNEIIYEENDGSGEWTGAVLSGTGIDINSTNSPRTGSKCIRAISTTNTSAIRLNKGSTINRDNYINLVMFIRSDLSSWGTGRIRVHFQNASGVRVGNIIDIRSGTFGFDSTNITGYQQVSIPLANFNIPASSLLQYLHITSSGGAISFHVDDIYLTPTGSTGGGGTSADALLKQNNLSDLANVQIARQNLDLREYILVACSDETTLITTGTSKRTFRMPFAGTLLDARASVTEAPTGSTIIIDVNKNGTTVLSTKLTIDASEKTSESAAAAEAISVSSFANDDEVAIDFDQVGSTNAGKGVKVLLVFRRTS